jgi:hypothetical protein
MIEKKSKSLARLSPKAQEAIGEMLTELSVIESDLILNTSKFVSFLLVEFKEKQFDKSKSAIAHYFRDRRKDAKNKLAKLTEEELEVAIKYLTKIKKVPPSNP